jgi:hypothetical protein
MSIGDVTGAVGQPLADISSLLDGAAVAVLKPLGAQGVAGFVFDIPTGESVDLESEVTDHYTEDNMFVNDHIVNKPVKIQLSGLVGELVYRKPQGILGTLALVGGGLASVAAFAGNYTPQFLQKAQGIIGKTQAVANQINQYLNQAQNALKAINSAFGAQQTAQQAAFNSLYALWRQKTIFSVTTPWYYFPQMGIVNINFRQDADSNDYSTVTFTLKEFRFAETKLSVFPGDSPDINGIQTSAPVTQGNAGTNDTAALDLVKKNGLLGLVTGGGSQ